MSEARIPRTTIDRLDENMIADILSRLPAKSIFNCRYVCKNWKQIISDSYFSKIHKSRFPIQFMIQFTRIVKCFQLFLIEVDEDSCISSFPCDYTIPRDCRLKFRDMFETGTSERLQISSCCSFSGCVLVSFVDSVKNRWKPYHIFNPITGFHIVVEQTNRSPLCPLDAALCFSQKTNQLKLLRFLSKPGCNKELELDIQTIGTNSWRTITRVPYFVTHPSELTFVNGFFHWISCLPSLRIFCFDIDGLKFYRLPAPLSVIIKDGCDVNLGSLEGCLCICTSDTRSHDFELWAMEEFGNPESWTKKIVIHFPAGHRLREFGHPLRYLKNGELVIVFTNCCDVVCANPHTGTYRSIKHGLDFYEALPYTANFNKLLLPSPDQC